MNGWKCPKCGSRDLEVVVTMWAALVQKSNYEFETDTDASEDGSQEWDGNSAMRCTACNHVENADKFEFQVCQDCEAEVKTLVGCPDGAEVCRDCFDQGKH